MNKNRRIVRLALAGAVVLGLGGLAGAAVAAKAKAKAEARQQSASRGLARYGVAVYSDLCLQSDSGDIGGQRITLHRFAEADTVIYEFTAGALSWPVVASDVNLDQATGVFDFTVQGADEEERKIVGKFARDGQSLTLEGAYCGGDASMPMKLSLVKDFGAKLKNCKPCPAPKELPEA
ncbi:hypothetical protein [Janthinobacterium agaricidamnosum]|uniref:Uncharacterized protein n=1 Tax=Janthinobacterium agaricidamnosum NBRC 102515 = DSM 9628 TaxID=1349767 RepID=W0VBU1_9BURK|nr:hypothetical protein [Janthinobacterium agaricidamnosum]CDG85095.1 hypothetical protein GJA_4488 [Janthinobacterium agaricidamnosum NBRC 102515 = DSM 9628]